MGPNLIYGLRPYPAFIGLLGQCFTSPTPRPFSFFLGLGGPFNPLGAYGPPSHHQGIWPNPSYYGGLGLHGLYSPWAITHGPQSVCCVPGSVGHLCPFWPNSNEAKGGQGGSPSVPKTTSGPPEPFFCLKFHPTQNGHKRSSGPKISKKLYGHHFSVHGLWQPPEATSSASSNTCPHIQGKVSPSSMHPVFKDPGVVHVRMIL
ncbi:hypothetical protein O181_125229 [Austropuccinia psidii MF-1]|uniref:Uncharacterized protein n=1 Tax=Austropuccinia psidii MF-1 TaxID=1389203 RepID=A0A9Q3Q506_9BASI|nr:hypothetical protein [Austropuccinia psidii MF-1]